MFVTAGSCLSLCTWQVETHCLSLKNISIFFDKDKSQKKNFHPYFKTIYSPIESPNCDFGQKKWET
jgi:hypothetical protein